MKKAKALCTYFVSSATVICAGAGPVRAQDQAASAGNEDQLSEVIVSAQRRDENLQNIPVSVSVVNSELLERANMTSVTDVPALVPGLIVSAGTGSMTTFLRGLGNPSNLAGNEASVPMYVDGVYYAHLSPALMRLNNIDHVEVVKGPQGTLFGRNSTGGLIQLITRTPTMDPTAEVRVGYANFDTVTADTYLSGGLTDSIAADLAVDYRNQEEGWGRNVFTGEDVRKERHLVLRSKVLWNITDDTRLVLSGDYVDSLTGQATIAANPWRGTTIGNPPGATPTIYPSLPDFYDINQNRPATEDSDARGYSLRFEHDFAFARLVSLTAYRSGFTDLRSDSDMTPLRASDAIQLIDYNQTSQELQLLSQSGGPVDWVGGLYYLKSVDGYPNNYNWGTNFGGNGISFVSQQVAKSYAAYSQGTWHVTPSTGITAGVRYTQDRVSGKGRTNSVAPTDTSPAPGFTILTLGPEASNRTDYSQVTWKAGIDQRLSDDILAYGSVSTGYKAGLYNLLPFNAAPLKPETNRAYEIGLKSTLLDKRLRMNVAAFWNEASNMQVQQSIAQGALLAVFSTNAAKARSRGIDFDAEMRVTPAFTSTLSLSVLDGKYTKFSGAPSSINNNFLVPFTDSNGNQILVVPGCTLAATTNLNTANGGNVNNCPVDASGNRLPRAPTVSGTLGLNYHIDGASGGGFDLAGYVTYNDGFYFLADNKLKVPSYTLVNASARYTFANDKTAIQLWGKNLTDEEYYSYASQFAGPLGNATVPAEPRTYGVSVSMKF